MFAPGTGKFLLQGDGRSGAFAGSDTPFHRPLVLTHVRAVSMSPSSRCAEASSFGLASLDAPGI